MIDLQLIGHSILRLESVDSTNNYAANLLNTTKVSNGTVILAENQLKGKGQRGNSWQVESGKNLTISIVLSDVLFKSNQQFLISQWVSVSLVELLFNFGILAKIKWPNDILVADNNEKIAGILIENTLQGQQIKHSIVGVGLNINQRIFEGIRATSMAKNLGRDLVLEDVLQAFLKVLNQSYLKLQKHTVAIELSYFTHLLGYNTWLNYEDNTCQFSAKIDTILPDGRLVLADKQNKTKTYLFKEVRLIL